LNDVIVVKQLNRLVLVWGSWVTREHNC